MEEKEDKYGFSQEEWETCLRVLEKLKDDPRNNPNNQYLGTLIAKIYKGAKKQVSKPLYEQRKAEDLHTILQAEIAQNARSGKTNYTVQKDKCEPTSTPLNFPRNCYCCNTPYTEAHAFYHKLCPACAKLNYAQRFAETDLSGRNAILTGGRVKIGYAAALKLLRAGANTLVTTRFPGLAFQQFQQESDFASWQERLELYGLDLRNLQAVEEFIKHVSRHYASVDFLINNAAQTIKYPEAYYAPLIQQEQQFLAQASFQLRLTGNQTPVAKVLQELPNGSLEELEMNRFGQPVDLRDKTSWNSSLEEVSKLELLEVNLINQISPYLLIKGLHPLLKASAFAERFIVNVTSSEGQFSYHNKTVFHPHTNMTKAALNMLTRTSAKAYAEDGIYMSAVDVGWVSTGAIEPLRQKQFERAYIPPLDPVDGAARILHPICEGIENQTYFVGQLLKNYQISDW